MARTDQLARAALVIAAAGLAVTALANVILYHWFQFFWLMGVAHLGLADLLPGWEITAPPSRVSVVDLVIWTLSLLVGLVALGLVWWARRLGASPDRPYPPPSSSRADLR